MQRLGIRQQDIQATEVIIKTPDKDIVITQPQVAKVNMMGQETFQITGNISERTAEVEINKDDVRTVAEQAQVGEEEALTAIKKHNGDLAAAILELKGE